ncbi:MAG TPA: hypothetical protein VK540_26785 [Polyangiaceae bacterium]|nr:hypothetical protein [Polyangiaceae bacterium]
MDRLRQTIYDAAETEHPVTCRRLFYRLVGQGVIEKTDAQYQGTVIRLLGEMREAGELPWSWITDNTRFQRKPESFSSMAEALETTARFYRRAFWDEQNRYVEVWCEKVGLSGVLYPITSEWDVPLMLCGGSPSKTFLYEAAKTIEQVGKPTFIYYLGDFDPSGVAIRERIDRDLRRYAPRADIEFVHVAVTEEQIEQYQLPTRPTKRSDPNAKKFGEKESVEVDAIPAPELRRLVEECVTQHIDDDEYQRLMAVESAERETLQSIAVVQRASSEQS